MKILSRTFRLNTFTLPTKSKEHLYGYSDDAIAQPKIDKKMLVSNKEIKDLYKVASCELFAQRLVESFFKVDKI